MKIVLFTVNASWSHSSLALRCLRAPLEREGFEVVIVENTLRDRTGHILERLYRERADVYGFSCYIWNLTEMLALGEALHEILPASRIVLGGPEVSFATERFDGRDWIDAIVCGEGEEVFPRLCRDLRDGKTYDRIIKAENADAMRDEGILYRDGDATGDILYYESSRGCPYSCAYCLSSATHGVRQKSVEQTLRDLLEFERAELPCKVIKFVDRTFNADVKRANAIWRALLDERYTKHYHFEVCASLLDEESLEILAKFPKGKLQLEFGLQSTNETTLAASSRHVKPKEVIAAVRRIYEMRNIHVHLDLIAGLPHEDYASFARSFDDAYGCSDMLQLGFLKLLYGTRLREEQEKYGYRCLPTPPYTVLESHWMSYSDIQRLSHIAETLDRYLESGRFSHALWYVTPRMRSPFAFWEGLTDYLAAHDQRPLQRISQPDAFRYFWEYARTAVESVEEAELRRMLGADFSQHENKNPPSFLR